MAGVTLLLMLVPIAALMTAAGFTRWGALEVLCLATLGGGLASRWHHRKRVTIGAVVGLTAVVVARFAITSQNDHVQVQTSGGERLVDAILDEEDVSLAATRVIDLTAFGRDPDVPVLMDAMRDGYARMRADVGSVGSPFAATYLGLQSPDAFDTVEIGDRLPSDQAPDTVLVFLHGFAGSFTLPCWQIAHAVRDLAVRTVCPATGWRGEWWSQEGERTVRAVIAAERARGAKHFLLAGLSNGAIGASVLAPRMRGTFDGLLLVSGVDPTAPSAGIPTLALQGSKDAMIPPAIARDYAARTNARRVDLPAGHFALLVEHERAEGAIASFVGGLVKPRPRTASVARPRG
jgi:pimeloyl-ACP methyl ester carboxylesterase